MLKEMSKKDQIILIEELREKNIPLKMLLDAMELSHSTYYARRNALARPDKYEELKMEIRSIYYQHRGWYGVRRITIELQNRGRPVGHKLVERLMKELGLSGRIKKRGYRSYKGDPNDFFAPNLLARDFYAPAPDLKWATDVTEFSIPAGKLYLSPIIDLYNREIVSFSIYRRPVLRMVLDMIKDAGPRARNSPGLILHSDHGWQYMHKDYLKAIHTLKIRQSMSRKGNCFDNAVIESFFGVIKREMFHGHEKDFQSLDELADAITNYIHYYNYERIKTSLGMPPIPYRHRNFGWK